MKQILSKKDLAAALSISESKINKDMVKKNNPLPHFFCGKLARYELDKVIEYYKKGK